MGAAGLCDVERRPIHAGIGLMTWSSRGHRGLIVSAICQRDSICVGNGKC